MRSKQVQDLLDKCAAAREADKVEPTVITLDRQEAEMLDSFLNSYQVEKMWITNTDGQNIKELEKWEKIAKKVRQQVWDLREEKEEKEEK